jgi:hypothetical protein
MFSKKPKWKYRMINDGKSWAVQRSDGKLADLVSWGYFWGPEGFSGKEFLSDCWDEKEKAEQFFKRYVAMEL